MGETKWTDEQLSAIKREIVTYLLQLQQDQVKQLFW